MKDSVVGKVYQLWCIDGYTYASCDRGLQRTSPAGVDTLIIKSGNDRITSLYKSDGILLAGTYNGVVHSFQNQVYRRINLPVRDNGAPFLVNSVVECRGSWWASTLEGVVFEVDPINLSFRPIALTDPKTKARKNILSMVRDDNENLWVISGSGVHFLLERKRRKKRPRYFLTSGNYNESTVDLVSSPKGIYSFSTENGKTVLNLGSYKQHLMDGSKNKIELPFPAPHKENINYCIEQNVLWILKGQKAYALENRNWKVFLVDGEVSDTVNSMGIIGDRLWVVEKDQIKSFGLLSEG